MLSDGHALYTPGLSENRGGAISFYANDRLGNLWTRDPASGKSQLTYEDFSGFGTPTAGNSAGSPFGFGGGNGCQTDADTGLVLMGHRYYDTRIGRFITQDPAKDGNNWYAYAGNDPTNKTDPSGLQIQDGLGASLSGSPGAMANGNGGNGWGDDDSESYEHNQQVKENIVQGLIARGISAPAAAAFNELIYDGYMTYGMIGQTVGNGKNGSSGDTHHIVPGTDYSASTDIRIGKLSNKEAEELVNELAFVGFAAFLRIPGMDHWPSDQARHIHAVFAGAALGASTLHQVMDFIHMPELNGLRSHAPYTFFHWNPGNVQKIYEAAH